MQRLIIMSIQRLLYGMQNLCFIPVISLRVLQDPILNFFSHQVLVGSSLVVTRYTSNQALE